MSAETQKVLWGLAEAALWFALIFGLIALGIEVVRRLRGRNERRATTFQSSGICMPGVGLATKNSEL